MNKFNSKLIILIASMIASSVAFAIGDNTGVGSAAGAVSGSTSAAQAASNSNSSSGATSSSNAQGGNAGAQAGSTATGFNNGQTQGQGQTNGFNQLGQGIGFSQDFSNHGVSVSTVNPTDLSRAVGSAYAPALTTTLTETCMGSTSVGAGWSGAALSFGTTWRDHACVRRLDAREIKSMGDIQAAKEIMCDSDLVRDAFKRVGRPCAEDGGTYVAVSQPVTPAPAPAAMEEAPAPMATDRKVHDSQDLSAQNQAEVLQKADAAREAIRAKFGF